MDQLNILLRNLRAARKGAGMTQKDVAQALGVSRSTISEIENGRRQLKVIELYQLSHLYHIAPETLIVDVKRAG